MPMDIDSEGEREASHAEMEGAREMVGLRQNGEMERKGGIQKRKWERGSWQIRQSRVADAASTIFCYIFYTFLGFGNLISNFEPMGPH